MAKARRLIEGNLKIIDVAIELVDARIPMSSTNPMIGQLLGQKPSIVVMNKADLADAEILKLWTAYYKEQGRMVMALNSKDGKGIKQLVQAVRKLTEPKLVKWRAKGLKSRSVRTIILGIPNVGKSTLINRLAGRNATKTADKPGETKGKQWVHLADNLDLLDTPGVLWPKLEEQKCARRLAATGAISDTVYDMEEVVADLITTLSVRYSEALKKRFKLSEIDEDPYKTIERIGRNRGAVLPGNRIDMEKTYKLIIKDFREGHIGPISLDMPEEFAEKQDG